MIVMIRCEKVQWLFILLQDTDYIRLGDTVRQGDGKKKK